MQTPSTQSNHAPEAFIQKHQADVTGILQGFDRLRLQGTLRSLYHPASMEAYLQLAHVLWKDFKTFTTGITARIRAASEGIARAAGRPFRYLPSVNLRKEEEAKKIALQDGIDSGLIAVFGCVEPCRTYFMRGNRESKCWSSSCSEANASIFTSMLIIHFSASCICDCRAGFLFG